MSSHGCSVGVRSPSPLAERIVSRHDGASGAAFVSGRPASSRAAAGSLRIDVVGSLAALREDWGRLAVASGNVFSTWEWADVWWRHFGQGREPAVVALTRPHGTVAAIVPLYRFTSRPVGIARLIGHGPADQLGPICAPEDLDEVTGVLPSAIAAAGCRAALLERLPGDRPWAATLGGRVLAAEPSPVLAIEAGTWDDLLAGWSANRRGQARRLERKLEREHDHRYVATADAESLDGDLDILFRLHRARWGEQSAFIADEPFHREFARTALERGWLRLWRMEIGGAPVAAWYGLRFAGALSYYQAGRDPSWEETAVGLALLLRTIRSAVEEGAAEYRFLRGDEAFKARYATHDPGIVSIGAGLGRSGRSLVAAMDLIARSPVRRSVRRVAGS
jgi:CelD/BcsL family acetyltransferase involved in cellulose biosynthesis